MPVAREKSTQTAIRLPNSLLKRLDEYVERLREEAPWSNASRADAVRDLIARGLAEVEKTGTRKPRK